MNLRLLRLYLKAWTLFLVFFIFTGCEKEIPDKYIPKDWLKGKIFSQISEQDDLNTFILCLELTGYDTLLNTSGSYSVFAPTDDAFDLFFQEHSKYNSLEDIPKDELIKIVEYQIIYDAWSIDQFKSLDYFGYIDPENELHKPRAYKHKTIYHPENRLYPVKSSGNTYKIAQPQESNRSFMAFSKSNKYCPVFFNEYFDVYNLNYDDYEFYFGRAFEPGNLNYADAKFNEEIPAENGFIYKTDRVVTPLPSAEEILEAGSESHSYSQFLELIYQFSEFNANMEATYIQPGAEVGLDVDTLYDLNFPELTFNIHNELTGSSNIEALTYRDHYGLLAPVDQAFGSFVNSYITPGWGSIDAMPIEIRKIIVNAYMSKNAIYPTNLSRGFINGNQDSIAIGTGDIVQRKFASNCTFIGLNQPLIPRAFISICRPMYLTRQYTTMLYAVEETKVLSAMKKPNVNYAFYLPTDLGIGMAGDSSLVRRIENADLNRYYFEQYSRGDGWRKIGESDLRKKILNQIAVSTPQGLANKEFIRNLGGNYIIVDHSEGTVSGSAQSTYGIGGQPVDLKPLPYPEQTDNGEVYTVNSFFNFAAGVGYYSLFISKYLEFFNLLSKAGLFDPSYYNFPFLVDGEYYTVFIPSAEALAEYGVDTLSKSELKELLQYHFVKENLIFTDGSSQSGEYPTTLVDESSSVYITRYSKMNIQTGPDVIQILDKNGNVYHEILEDKNRTNQMISFDPNKQSDSNWDYITTGVVHEIDKVLVRDSLQVN